MRAPTRTSLVPSQPASLRSERAQLELSSRSLVFAWDGDRLFRAWGPPERPWALAIHEARGRWIVEAWGADPRTARRAARDLFSLDDPLAAFYRRTRAEPTLRGTERRFRGLRLPRDASVYEALLHTVIGQQVSIAAANSIKRRLFAKYGRTLEADGVEVPCVPPPSRLGAAGAAGLRAVGLSRAKARYLLAVAAGARQLPTAERLRAEPLDDARVALESWPGIGRWSAENILLRGAGRRDAFVAGDLGIRVALARYGAVDRAAPEAEARSWAERYYPGWGSYATLYLWRKLVADRTAASGG